MSVYEDKTAHKIYPSLDPTAPPSLDPQPYQLAKVSKIEKLLPLWDRPTLPAGHENEAIQHHYICSWHWSCHHDNRNWRYFNFKLDNISNAISQTIQDENTSTQEFHKILQETEKYRQLKAEVRTTAKRKVSAITNKQRKEILEQGRLEGRTDFLKQIAKDLGTQPANVT